MSSEAVSSSLAFGSAGQAEVRSAAQVKSLPWYCFAVAFGALCIPLGVLWDISWHSTIGRDTFWTPAHMLIYNGGALPGLLCGWLVLKTTFWGTAEEKLRSVRIWGFSGPLGAWVVIWGSIAMITSAPFDDWWHNAYGLDVKILSPPHTLLALGMYGVAIGAWLLVLSWQNRAGDDAPAVQRAGTWLFIITGGVLIAMLNIFLTEMSQPNSQRTATFYFVSCAAYPFYMTILARAAKTRWAATKASLVFMAIVLGMAWILPLFAAQPMLAPIYNPVTKMVPPAFPLLLVIPALAVDFLIQRHDRKGARTGLGDLGLAAMVAVAFTAVFVLVQWNFSALLISPAADNWFLIGKNHFGYMSRPGEWQHQFWDINTSQRNHDAFTAKSAVIAVGLAFVAAWIGLWRGNGMKAVKR